MDRERRKRKNLENERLQKEEDEDEKMERFFALIRSTKDIRDRLLARSSRILEENNRDSGPSSIWNPSIHPPDFMEIAGPSSTSKSNKQQHREEEEDDEREGGKLGTKEDANKEEKNCNMLDLDLNLSL